MIKNRFIQSYCNCSGTLLRYVLIVTTKYVECKPICNYSLFASYLSKWSNLSELLRYVSAPMKSQHTSNQPKSIGSDIIKFCCTYLIISILSEPNFTQFEVTRLLVGIHSTDTKKTWKAITGNLDSWFSGRNLNFNHNRTNSKTWHWLQLLARKQVHDVS